MGNVEYLHPCLTKVKTDLRYPVFLCKKNLVSLNIFMESAKIIASMQTLQPCPDMQCVQISVRGIEIVHQINQLLLQCPHNDPFLEVLNHPCLSNQHLLEIS
jgi:hypothetical protein